MQRALEGIDSAGKTSDICKLLRMVQNTLLVTIRLELALSFRWLLSMGHVLYFQKLLCASRHTPQDNAQRAHSRRINALSILQRRFP